jgi:hypothetical protein
VISAGTAAIASVSEAIVSSDVKQTVAMSRGGFSFETEETRAGKYVGNWNKTLYSAVSYFQEM